MAEFLSSVRETALSSLSVFNVPRIRLSVSTIRRPSAMLVFSFVFFSYFLVLSGIIYDVIVEPPSIGMSRDEVSGHSKPEVFLQHRINGQYIIEGLSAGFFFALGGLGIILLDFVTNSLAPKQNRYLLALSGVLLFGLSYILCLVYLRNKIPGY